MLFLKCMIIITLLLINNICGVVKFLVDENEKSGPVKSWSAKAYDSSRCGGAWSFDTGKWVTCFGVNQRCRLETNYFQLNNISALFFNVTFITSTCSSNDRKYPDCQEQLKLVAYNGLTNPSNLKDDDFRIVALIPSAKIPANYTKEFFTSSDVMAVNLTPSKYIRFGFDTTNYCGTLSSANFFYYQCPQSTASLVSFKITNAPSEVNSPKRVPGVCSDNAIAVEKNIVMECYANGTFKVHGSCVCEKGYEKDGAECKECRENYFKADSGNHLCSRCGDNSVNLGEKTSCTCKEDFYRSLTEEKDHKAHCYAPPSAPRLLTAENITSNSVILRWLEPEYYMTANGYYLVECVGGDAEESFSLNTTELTIQLYDLAVYVDYVVKVSYRNNITGLIGQTLSKEISFKTLFGAPGVIRQFKVVVKDDDSVFVLWQHPVFDGQIFYKIEYGNVVKTLNSKTSILLESEMKDKTYTIKITPYSTANGHTYYGETFTREVFVKGSIKIEVILGIVLGSLLLIIFIVGIVFCVWKRRHPMYFQPVRMEDGTVKLHGGRLMNHGKLYVDPTTYDDVGDAVQEFAYELDRKQVKLGELLGGGEFAQVYKGTLTREGKSINVAVKTLKYGASKHDRDDFLSEAAILGQFSNQNVISIEGVILKDRPNVIVLEFMENGALDKFLQENDMQFTILQLLGMARGVANGMKYLSEMGFIHRDLAARNILVDEQKVCKVADFGMSRQIKVDETYDTKGGKIPVRWTAPEAIQFKKFTTASDTWSYGVLLWEIMSYGERPYWDWGNYEVLERINSGYRLPPPMKCPKIVHNLMLHCWNKDRTKRPKFSNLRDTLEKWIRNPEQLQEIASVVKRTDENLDYANLLTINKWLEAISMENYTSNFLNKGYATPRQLVNMTLDDLQDLGIEVIGHRKKIHKVIQRTKDQLASGEQNNRSSSVSGRSKLSFSQKK